MTFAKNLIKGTPPSYTVLFKKHTLGMLWIWERFCITSTEAARKDFFSALRPVHTSVPRPAFKHGLPQLLRMAENRKAFHAAHMIFFLIVTHVQRVDLRSHVKTDVVKPWMHDL